MGANSNIAWTDHTFNPWWGCFKVDPLCDNCYASDFSRRTGHDIWGREAPRRFFGDAHWNEPRKWNREAAAAGVRRRVFCASMGDVFEDRVDLLGDRAKLWTLISETPNLDWLLLSKRPENFAMMLPWTSFEPFQPWPNVHLGVSAGTRKGWQLRVPKLRATPAAVRFVSMEPLLEEVDVTADGGLDGINQVIVGGESGPKRRPMELAWMERAVADATAAGCKVFVKQDTALRPGQRGRISLPIWERKEFSEVAR